MCSGMHTLWFGCPPSSRPVCLPHVPPPCSYSCAITLLMHPAPLLLTHACQCTLHCLPLTHACRSSPATRSYGFAIILLTVLVKLATYPLTAKQVLCAPSVAACRRLVWPGLFCCSLSWLQCWGGGRGRRLLPAAGRLTGQQRLQGCTSRCTLRQGCTTLLARRRPPVHCACLPPAGGVDPQHAGAAAAGEGAAGQVRGRPRAPAGATTPRSPLRQCVDTGWLLPAGGTAAGGRLRAAER